MEKDKYTTEWLQTAEELLRHIKAFGFTPEKLLEADSILHPRQGNIVQGETENARSGAPQQPLLIKEPDGTLKDTKRYMRELGELLLHRHHQALEFHDLKDAVLWIFAKHKPSDPFYRECLIAEKLRIGGRKCKEPLMMYHYARQGRINGPTVRSLIRQSHLKAEQKKHEGELAEVAKLDPCHIYRLPTDLAPCN